MSLALTRYIKFEQSYRLDLYYMNHCLTVYELHKKRYIKLPKFTILTLKYDFKDEPRWCQICHYWPRERVSSSLRSHFSPQLKLIRLIQVKNSDQGTFQSLLEGWYMGIYFKFGQPCKLQTCLVVKSATSHHLRVTHKKQE